MVRRAVLATSAALLVLWLVAAVDVVWRADQIPPVDVLAPWTTAEGREVLDGWGVPVRSWAAVVVLLNAVPAVAGALAAWFVLRGQATGFRCFVALTLVLFGTAGSQVTGLISALHPGSTARHPSCRDSGGSPCSSSPTCSRTGVRCPRGAAG